MTGQSSLQQSQIHQAFFEYHLTFWHRPLVA